MSAGAADGEPALRRARVALKESRHTLVAAAKAVKAGDRRAAAELESRALRHYIGDKLDLEGGALTPADAARLLGERRIDAALVAEVQRQLERCDALQYRAHPDDADAADVAAVTTLVQRLERALRT